MKNGNKVSKSKNKNLEQHEWNDIQRN